MKNPFATALKATRLVGRGRPLSAAFTLSNALAPVTKPKRTGVQAPQAKPATRRRAAAARPPRPVPGSFASAKFGSGPAAIAYKLYMPRGSVRRRMPMVVMLHGCLQTASDIAAGTDMNALADEMGFVVLYPEQSQSANLGRCWNWHRPGDQKRGSGEPAAIAALTLHAVSACRVNPERIYIAGISAGGSAASIIAAAYPEIYAAVGVHSAVARGSIASLTAALSAMRSGPAPTTARAAPRPRPTIVFHGDQDNIVHPANAVGFRRTIERSRSGPLTQRTERGQSDAGRAYTRTELRNAAGAIIFENWTIHGSGHAWSGGKRAGSHTDPAGPDASRAMLDFFLKIRRPDTGRSRT